VSEVFVATLVITSREHPFTTSRLDLPELMKTYCGAAASRVSTVGAES
jgi:hypothetical protein